VFGLNYLELAGIMGRIENAIKDVKYDRAETLAFEALNRTSSNQPDSPDADLINMLASMAALVECKLGKFDRALDLVDRYFCPSWERFNISKSKDAAKHVALRLNTLGCVFDDLNRADLALICYQKSLALKGVARDEDVEVQTVNIGYANTCIGNYAEAEKYLRQSLCNLESGTKKNSEITVSAKANLGECLIDQGRFDEAAPFIWSAQAQNKRRLTKNHPSRARSNVSAARLLTHQGQEQEAKQCFEEALDICKHSVGSEHSETAYVMKHYGEFLRRHNKPDLADQMEQSASSILVKLKAIEVPERLQRLLTGADNGAPALNGDGNDGGNGSGPEINGASQAASTVGGEIELKQMPRNKDGIHPSLALLLKSTTGSSLLMYALILYMMFQSKGSGTYACIFLLIAVGGRGMWQHFRGKKNVRRLSDIIYHENPATARLLLTKQRDFTGMPSYFGIVQESSSNNLASKKIFFNYPGPAVEQIFNGDAVKTEVYTDSLNGKPLAVNTRLGLLIVNNRLTAGFTPAAQIGVALVSTIGITAGVLVMLFMFGSGLSKTVPDGLSAQRYYDLGVNYKDGGWTEQSRSLNRAIKLDPNGVGKKADLYRRTKLPHKPATEEAVQMNIAGFNAQVLDSRKAEQTWKECIKKYPEFEWPYSNLGSLYVEQNRLKEAQPLLQKAIELNPDYVNGLIHMAELKRKQKDFREAKKYIDKILELEPDNQPAQMLKMSPNW
jgi:tetratricopeptide (TPR) repeat protein